MIISRQLTRLSLAGVLVGLSLAANARSQPEQASADIRRTSFGVPHIRADNERGLGYGIGYAYAQDNLCLLANEITTVNGERSRYFGPDQFTVEERENLVSDLFFNWLNTPQAVEGFWQAQTPQVRDLIEGYVAGYNRSLTERRVQGLPQQCQGDWVREITAQDLVKLTRRLLVEGGVGQFAEALAGATPPKAVAHVAGDPLSFQVAASRMQRFALDRGSNAVAVGSERSFNGRGMLLANPHFPWVGGMRFYQMHLTIPGKLDVMGAALPGLPMINIGFNQHLAWTHTVDSSKHFTLYRLQLDPKDSTRYLLDGKSLPMKKQTLTVNVKQPDGQTRPVSHVVYSSQFGPIVQWPGKLDWDNQFAYSLRDANLDNDRVLQQWYAMNRAVSLKDLQASVHKIQGIPWVNTLATDDQGQTLYMNLSVVPNVSADKLARCSDPRAGLQMIVLDGSNSACAWDIDPHGCTKRHLCGRQVAAAVAQGFCAALQRFGLDGQPGATAHRFFAADQPGRPAIGAALAFCTGSPEHVEQGRPDSSDGSATHGDGRPGVSGGTSDAGPAAVLCGGPGFRCASARAAVCQSQGLGSQCKSGQWSGVCAFPECHGVATGNT